MCSAQRGFCHQAPRSSCLFLLSLLLSVTPARAEQAQPEATREQEQEQALDDAEIARRLTNPIAQIVAIPLDFSWDQGVGPYEDLRLTLRVRPLVPVPVTDNWYLIGRLVLPLLSQPALVEGGEPSFGLGDLRLSLFLTPNALGPLVWGVGPSFGLPLSTDPALGTGKWLAGPTGAALLVFRQALTGVVAEHLWSLANTGDIERQDVNLSSFRALAAYTTLSATTFSLVSQLLVNWNAPDGEKLTWPILAELSQVIRFGPLPLSIGVGGGYFIERPQGGPQWRLSLSFTLTLPSIKQEKAAKKKLLGGEKTAPDEER